ncbi:MAG: acylphosphatase [Geminicoccaceae bacterium]|nr:acylphosphatase [Geminicoccaceae bacterium]
MVTHLRIRGRVQGVGYRAWFMYQAEARGLSGWVRNRVDGSVEALVAGDTERVSSLIEAAHEGPRWSRVESVDREEALEFPDAGFRVEGTI